MVVLRFISNSNGLSNQRANRNKVNLLNSSLPNITGKLTTELSIDLLTFVCLIFNKYFKRTRERCLTF